MITSSDSVLTPRTTLLALGECTHLDAALAWRRNELLGNLVDRGFRSIALEIDRVAACAVDDHVRGGGATQDEVMAQGFSHGFGRMAANVALVRWLREYNQGRPPQDQVRFHGFDAATETYSAPSPRPHLQHVADYLGLDLDIADLAGGDARWSRSEAVLDPSESPGDDDAARRLRCLADDMVTQLHARAPQLIAATSPAHWQRARIVLAGGLGLLRYHHQCAQQIATGDRLARLFGTRDALMAENLLDIRCLEADRGPTLVFAHNRHLQRLPASRRADPEWAAAGATVAALLGDHYVFVAGSLGRSDGIDLGEPAPDTYEGALQQRVDGWELLTRADIPVARTRSDHTPQQGYFPLDAELLAGADAVLHITEGRADTSWM